MLCTVQVRMIQSHRSLKKVMPLNCPPSGAELADVHSHQRSPACNRVHGKQLAGTKGRHKSSQCIEGSKVSHVDFCLCKNLCTKVEGRTGRNSVSTYDESRPAGHQLNFSSSSDSFDSVQLPYSTARCLFFATCSCSHDLFF